MPRNPDPDVRRRNTQQAIETYNDDVTPEKPKAKDKIKVKRLKGGAGVQPRTRSGHTRYKAGAYESGGLTTRLEQMELTPRGEVADDINYRASTASQTPRVRKEIAGNIDQVTKAVKNNPSFLRGITKGLKALPLIDVLQSAAEFKKGVLLRKKRRELEGLDPGHT